MSHEKFMNSSIFLFLDIIVIAISGWLYWLVISKFLPISDVGQSTAVYSLVVLTGTIVGLGLEYPLLKNSSIGRSKVVGSALLIEIIITIVAVPFLVYTLRDLQYESLQGYTLLAIGMLFFISLGFVGRYALLGISSSKTILIIDTVSTAVKFAVGYFLVVTGFGTFGVLLSFMLQALIATCISLYLANKIFGFRIISFSYVKDTFKNGIVNIPSIFSRTLIVSLSVVLLAAFGLASSEIGIFYISLMISVVAGGLISSTAYMVIPASSMAQKDLTSGSIRIGISLTAPIISLLLVSSKFILSLIGSEYVSGEILLMILSIAILPFAIATNTISRLNILGKSRELLLVGSLQMIGFIMSFVLLVPHMQGVGAAISILISYSISCIPTLFWSDRILLRYIANTVASVVAGLGVSIFFKALLPEGIVNVFVTLFTSVLITLIVIFALKNTSISEVKILLKTVIKGPTST